MAQKGGKVKRFLLIFLLIALVAIVFILMGGDKILTSTGKNIEKVGKQAGEIKSKIEEKAADTGKAVEKVIDTVKPGEKK